MTLAEFLRWLVEDQQLGLGGQHAGNGELLLLAPLRKRPCAPANTRAGNSQRSLAAPCERRADCEQADLQVFQDRELRKDSRP